MNTRITRHDGTTCIQVQIDPPTMKIFHRVGAMARHFVSLQDPELWRKVSNETFLDHVEEGAGILTLLGGRPCVRLSPNQAQYTLGAACLLTLHLERQPGAYRIDLLTTLQILAEACPCELQLKRLPDPARLKFLSRWDKGTLELYLQVWKAFAAGEKPTVQLGDACRLLVGIPSKRPRSLDPLITALWSVTCGYRASLERLLEGAS